ncbi:ShlB/FhaC/HecB family hemolysin secretion/activation protein [Roseateles sp.]|uniref:ShlB/FhaC/HecB family hemolysin secretion/activation protein n=1 Tax=Roseateles sp. TaxID=1971397 RepID=UPI003BA402BD
MKSLAFPTSARLALALNLFACGPLGLLSLAPLTAQAQPAAEANRPAESAEPRFPILEFEVEGNTVLSALAIEKVLLPFMGESRQMADVEGARAALEKRYQEAGYLTVFVDVPEQRVDEGLILLRVTEGRVELLRVTGSRYYDQGMIRERVAQLAPGTVPDFNEVQRQLASLSRAERQVQPVLRPGLVPGTVEAELKVSDQLPMSATFELNNRHAANTEPWRASLNLRYDNLWQRDHGLSLSYITAPKAPEQSKVLVANYTAPLSASDTLLLSVVLSDSLVEPLGAGKVIGKGSTWGARWLRSVGRADELHSFSLGADYKNVKEDQASLSTPLKYLPFQLGYTGNWFGNRSQITLNTSLVFAVRSLLQRDIDCLGNSGKVDQFQCKRDGADGGFAYWRGELRDNRPLAAWVGSEASLGSLSSRVGWQLATQPLVSGEQFSIGGADTVRGFLEAEASGDSALLASLEWRSANLLNLASPASGSDRDAGTRLGFWRELSLLAFLDAARVQTLQPLPEQSSATRLLGTGLGLRLRTAPNLSTEFDLAWPLKSTAFSRKGEPRVHVRLSAQI